VLSLRNFQPKRNIDVLVRAFARVRREEPSARLLLAARGSETKAEIARLVVDLELGEQVRFVRLEADDVPRLAASADVTVTISDHDSSSAALLEAMASEQSIVGGWCPSIDEWIGPGEGAEMVEPRDEDALVGALLRLLRDPELRRRYGRRNAEVARAPVEEAGPALETLYRELAGRRALVPAA